MVEMAAGPLDGHGALDRNPWKLAFDGGEIAVWHTAFRANHDDGLAAQRQGKFVRGSYASGGDIVHDGFFLVGTPGKRRSLATMTGVSGILRCVARYLMGLRTRAAPHLLVNGTARGL